MLSDSAIWESLSTPGRLVLIAGPCVIESEKLCLQVASALKRACQRLGVFYVFKASYDKANRTAATSFRGPGLEAGLAVLAKVRARVGIPVLTDIHTEAQAPPAAQVADVLQIPAFLCRQTDLIAAAVRTGRIVNLKKGQFLSPEEMGQAVDKARRARSSFPAAAETARAGSASSRRCWPVAPWPQGPAAFSSKPTPTQPRR